MTTTSIQLHLTQLRLNPRSVAFARDLRNVHSLHQRLMGCFTDHQDLGDRHRAQLGLLYRLERDARGHFLLIQSHYRPDLSALPAGYTTTDVTDLRACHRDITSLLDKLTEGATVHYRIDTNPVMCAASSPAEPGRKRRRGRRTPLNGGAADEWWLRQAGAAGLRISLDETYSSSLSKTVGFKEVEDGKVRISIQRRRYAGTGTITDPESLRHALVHGIGKNRAYGCGLLSLARTRP